MQKFVFLVDISVIAKIVDIVNVLRNKYLIKSMTIGGNDKLDVKAVLRACIERGIALSS